MAPVTLAPRRLENFPAIAVGRSIRHCWAVWWGILAKMASVLPTQVNEVLHDVELAGMLPC
jgi:hypothetical protein